MKNTCVCVCVCVYIYKANWIGHILRRNCLPQQVIEGKIKGQIEVERTRNLVAHGDAREGK